MAAQASTYPLRFDVEYPEKLSRLLIFVKWLLAIPHLLILYALGAVTGMITFIAFFAILFTKRYPQGLFDFVVNVYRWQANVGAYIFLLRDEYPPFTWEAGKYPVTFEVDYPEQLSRWLIFIKWLLVIPNIIVFFLLLIVAYVVEMIAWLAILFTGGIPRGLFDFLVGVARWSFRINAYSNLLRDDYPPFSMK
ncbi:MAG: DUF4389 domain-containing protein [Chloroflexi bacterium]|nr:DUF4389 domain-containing protein [Chloroflexota bacterium]